MAQFGSLSGDALHVMIESKKLAYADLLRYVGDPKYSSIPVAQMLSKEYAKNRAAQIDMKRANCNVAAGTLPTGGDLSLIHI